MTNLISDYSLYSEAIRIAHTSGCRVHKLRGTEEGRELLRLFIQVLYPGMEPDTNEIEKHIDIFLKGFFTGYSINMVDNEETEP